MLGSSEENSSSNSMDRWRWGKKDVKFGNFEEYIDFKQGRGEGF